MTEETPVATEKLTDELRALAAKWRAEARAVWVNDATGTCAEDRCADELDAVLAGRAETPPKAPMYHVWLLASGRCERCGVFATEDNRYDGCTAPTPTAPEAKP